MHNSFFKLEKFVIPYIIDHPDKVIRLSITELAENTGVSETTVMRYMPQARHDRVLGSESQSCAKYCLSDPSNQ